MVNVQRRYLVVTNAVTTVSDRWPTVILCAKIMVPNNALGFHWPKTRFLLDMRITRKKRKQILPKALRSCSLFLQLLILAFAPGVYDNIWGFVFLMIWFEIWFTQNFEICVFHLSFYLYFCGKAVKFTWETI